MITTREHPCWVLLHPDGGQGDEHYSDVEEAERERAERLVSRHWEGVQGIAKALLAEDGLYVGQVAAAYMAGIGAVA